MVRRASTTEGPPRRNRARLNRTRRRREDPQWRIRRARAMRRHRPALASCVTTHQAVACEPHQAAASPARSTRPSAGGPTRRIWEWWLARMSGAHSSHMWPKAAACRRKAAPSRPEPQSAPGAAPCCVRAAAASTARASGGPACVHALRRPGPERCCRPRHRVHDAGARRWALKRAAATI